MFRVRSETVLGSTTRCFEEPRGGASETDKVQPWHSERIANPSHSRQESNSTIWNLINELGGRFKATL